MTRRVFIAGGIGAFTGLGLPARVVKQSEKPLVEYWSPRRYHVEHLATVTNGEFELATLEVWLPVPQDGPGQRVGLVEIEPEVRVYESESGQARVAKLYIGDRVIGRGESRTLRVAYDVLSWQTVGHRDRILAAPYRPYRRDRMYAFLTRAEPRIETGHAGITEQATRLRGDRRPAAHIALDTYEWVLERTAYQPVGDLGGAAYCFSNRHGECGDYSALFVALCRAAGVPARVVTGCWAEGKDRWHVWAEFMLPTGEWIPIDPQIGDQNEWSRRHCFGNLDNRRVAMCRGLEVRLADCLHGSTRVDYLQSGHFWWWSYESTRGRLEPQAAFTVTGSPVDAREVTTRPS